MLNEDDIDELYEQPYLINSISQEDRLVAQYADKVGDVMLTFSEEDESKVFGAFYASNTHL